MTANQEAWLAALESDEFKQTQGKLQHADGFCCLGVACVMAERAGIFVYEKYGIIYGTSLNDQETVKGWLGLRTGSGHAGPGVCLVNMNDEGKTFKEIAAAIRADPDHYFVKA